MVLPLLADLLLVPHNPMGRPEIYILSKHSQHQLACDTRLQRINRHRHLPIYKKMEWKVKYVHVSSSTQYSILFYCRFSRSARQYFGPLVGSSISSLVFWSIGWSVSPLVVLLVRRPVHQSFHPMVIPSIRTSVRWSVRRSDHPFFGPLVSQSVL